MKKRSPRYKEGAGVFQPRLPADQRSQQLAVNAAKNLISKSPVQESSVVTNFDARPVNAHDFYDSGGTFVLDNGDPQRKVGAFFNYTVPNGYRAILRGYKYTIIPFRGDNLSTNIVFGILTVGDPTTQSNPATSIGYSINGTIVPGYSVLYHGQHLNNYQPCYVLAEEGETISLILNAFNLVNDGPPTILTAVNISLYGNLLLANGSPLAFTASFTNPVPVKIKE